MSPNQAEPPALAVAGPVTLEEVARHRGAWLAALAQGAGLRLDLDGSGPWDVAGLQLLLSALGAGGPVRLAGMPAGLRELAGRAGVLDRLDAAAV